MKHAVSARLSERTAPEVANAIYLPGMLGFDAAALENMCRLNEAHVVMLCETGLIGREVASQILGGIAQIRREGPAAIDLDPRFEDSYFAFENRLGELIGKEATGWVHIGRSRNDIGATLDRMRARALCLEMTDAMAAARSACLAAVQRHSETIMPGYTHLQPAQPITFGYYLLNLAGGLEREHERMAAAYDRIDLSSLGAAALAGTGFAIDRARTAELLGFTGIVVPNLDAVASRDFVMELLWTAVSTLTLLSRVCQDLYAFTTAEFGALSFPDRVAGTSSIMPQKKNMLALEYFRAAAGRGLGALSGCLASVKGSNYSIGLDSVREGIADAWPALDRFAEALALLRLLLETAKPDAERLRQRCYENFATATDLADGLVREHAISFREAHHVVGAAVQLTLAAGHDARGLTPEVLRRAAESVLGRAIEVDAVTLQAWLDPVNSVRARATPGGTAPEEVLRLCATMDDRLTRDRRLIDQRQQDLTTAALRCAEAVAAAMT